MHDTCQIYQQLADIHGIKMVRGQVPRIKCRAWLRTVEVALLLLLAFNVDETNLSIPISKVFNHDSSLCGYEIDMQQFQYMAVFAVYDRLVDE